MWHEIISMNASLSAVLHNGDCCVTSFRLCTHWLFSGCLFRDTSVEHSTEDDHEWCKTVVTTETSAEVSSCSETCCLQDELYDVLKFKYTVLGVGVFGLREAVPQIQIPQSWLPKMQEVRESGSVWWSSELWFWSLTHQANSWWAADRTIARSFCSVSFTDAQLDLICDCLDD